MTGHLVRVDPPLTVYRLARGPRPWEWPDWSRAHTDGTFGNRYDDPQGVYRVLYACSQRIGVFVETMARYRPDVHVLASLDEIKAEAEDDEDTVVRPGQLHVGDWLDRRRMGQARLAGVYCDIGHEQSLAYLRERLAPLLLDLGYPDFDAATLRTADRRITQQISRIVYEAEFEGESFSGIRYRSRLGDDLDNWAVFEGAEVLPTPTRRVAADDPDLVQAAANLGIELL